MRNTIAKAFRPGRCHPVHPFPLRTFRTLRLPCPQRPDTLPQGQLSRNGASHGLPSNQQLPILRNTLQGTAPRLGPGDGATAKRTKRRGGSGCGNVGTFPRTESRGIGCVGPSGSKITRARNQKRPGTNGGGRNQEGEALNRTPSEEIRLWAVFPRGSAHEPPPENVASGRDVVGMLDRRRVRA